MNMPATVPRRVKRSEEDELLARQARQQGAERIAEQERHELEAFVLELHDSGCRAADIAEILQVQRSTIYLMVKRASGR